MKKTGIITFHSAHNYGAMLQVYALQSKIENSEIINFRNKDIDNDYKIFKVHSGKNILKIAKSVISSVCYYKKNKERYNKFNNFFNNNLKLSAEYRNEKELKENPPQYDVYITGSDQVWNYTITKGLKDSYTLNFGDKKIKRISYAASLGKASIPNELVDEYKNKISKIDYISVREQAGKNALKEAGIEKNIEVVLDPTLLLTKEEWDEEIGNKENQVGEKYILAYVVEDNEEYYKIVNDLSRKTGLKVVHFGKRDNKYQNVLKSAYTEGPLEFVNLIRNAEYVVATSFHATVFSVIYNKKFFIVPHLTTGSRVTNLLDKLEIKGRTFKTLDEFKGIDYDFETDYESVEKILKQEREKSIQFLKGAIEKE